VLIKTSPHILGGAFTDDDDRQTDRQSVCYQQTTSTPYLHSAEGVAVIVTDTMKHCIVRARLFIVSIIGVILLFHND